MDELAGAGTFQNALHQIPQFSSLSCQSRYPFITATQPSKGLEPVAGDGPYRQRKFASRDNSNLRLVPLYNH